MDYKLNLGGWGSVFAVPSAVVDNYIKLASGISVKVLLYFLRHSNEAIDSELIASTLSVSVEDVNDAMCFWQQVGLLARSENELVPAKEDISPEPAIEKAPAVDTEQIANQARIAAIKATVMRTPEFSPKEIAQTIKSDERVEYIFKSTEKLIGKPLRPTEQKVLVQITEYIGLPADVTMMLIDYSVSVDKFKPAYLKSTAMDWMENGITTYSEAERVISEMQCKSTAESVIKRVFGISRALSQKEKDFALFWFMDLGYDEDIIRRAYDINVNSKGKFSFDYINKVLQSWHDKGYKTASDIDTEQKKKPADNNSTFDVSALDKSILDEYE